jgi:hypothetical protein
MGNDARDEPRAPCAAEPSVHPPRRCDPGLAFDERELGAIVLAAVGLVLPVMIVFAIAFFYLASVR